MIYTLTGHPLLDETSKGLFTTNGAAFIEQVAMAAENLGIHAIEDWTDAQLVRATRYLALQVNWQLKLKPDIFLRLQESSTASHNNVTYRRDIGLVDPRAAAGISTLLEETLNDQGRSRWGTLTSVRSNVR